MSDQATELPDDLTDEEREALNYQEPTEDVNESEQQTEAATGETDEGATGEAVADADDAPAVADDAAAPVVAVEEQPAVEPEAKQPVAEQPKAAPAPAPILIVDAPADAQDRLSQIATDKAALLDKYENGDITAKELHTQTDALNEQQFELRQQLREAELARKLEAQRAQNEWDGQCRSFLEGRTEYHGDAGKDRFQALDEAIKAMARMPINKGVSGDKLLLKAHNAVRAAYGDAPEAAAAPQKKINQPVVPKPAIPPTNIGKLPAADANDTSGSEFAALDTLAKGADVEAYEAALTKLSDSQRARYMAR